MPSATLDDDDPDGIRLAAELARAQLMSGHPKAALALIEQILPIADRADLREVVAELLPSRGWAIGADGRALEAVALLRGALSFAEREGFILAELRTRMNLSAWGSGEWPAEAYEVAETGSRRARERGYIGFAGSLAGNASDCALLLGEWDWIEEIAAELDVLADWASAWDFTVPGVLAVLRSYRGRRADAHEIVDRYMAQFPDLLDPQMLLSLLEVRHHLAFAEGDLDEVMRLSRELRHRAIDLGVRGADYLVMGAAALERGDVTSLEEIVEVARSGMDAGRLNRIRADVVAGGLRVLQGDLDGLSVMDRATETFRSEGIRFDLALSLRARALVAPEADDAAAIAQEARATIEALGAVTLLRGLPAAPAADASSSATTADAQQPINAS